MDSIDISRPYPAGKLELHLLQIRLVSILPGRYSDAIVCELRTADVENLPGYYSLSYAWGDWTDLCHILLNGVSFNVTRNLEAALRRLRQSTESRLFWIDMLCINQDSVEERSHQVNLMQLIYSGAQEVFLWLGDYADTTLPNACPSFPSKGDQEVSVKSTISSFRVRTESRRKTFTDSNQNLSEIEVSRGLNYIERLFSDQHLGFSEAGDLPPHLAAEVRALDKLMNSSW